jgi:hypothetical protein
MDHGRYGHQQLATPARNQVLSEIQLASERRGMSAPFFFLFRKEGTEDVCCDTMIRHRP